MINVLPPETKRQLKFTRLNSRLTRYLLVAIVVGATLISLLFISLLHADGQIKSYQTTLDSRQSQRKSFTELEANVEKLQSNLTLINSLLTEKTQYSSLLDDLAATLPSNSFITQMQLTGDDKKPMELTVSTDSFNRAAEVRNGLIQSKRIKSADIQTVNKDSEGGTYTVVLVIAFEKDEAR